MTPQEMQRQLKIYIATHHDSQADFADAIGTSSSYVSQMLSGKRRPIKEVLSALGLEEEIIVRYKKVKR